MDALRAGAALPLTGRYAPFAADAARGLRSWADAAGVEIEIVDCGESPAAAGRAARGLAARVDVLFGPYGSGATRAVADALVGERTVVWNHGGAAVERAGARLVDVLGPADTYWWGLADVLGDLGVRLDRVAVLHAPSGFGRRVARGAIDAVARAGCEPVLVAGFEAGSAGHAADSAVAAGAAAIVGCGRFEDDVALGAAAAGRVPAVGLVACGAAGAADALGPVVEGMFGPCQWLPGDVPAPEGLGATADYPAAQAYAAGLVAHEAIARAGSSDPDAVWDAAIALRTRTFLGPFRVDAEGRQMAHRPLIVR